MVQGRSRRSLERRSRASSSTEHRIVQKSYRYHISLIGLCLLVLAGVLVARARASTNIVDIAAGGYHSLALGSNGTVWAWGQNSAFQLGDGTKTNRLIPVVVFGLTNGGIAIAGGYSHSLALISNNSARAWGDNTLGKLGDGTTNNRSVPVAISNLTTFALIAGGGDHSLAMNLQSNVWAWGANASGQLGDFTVSNRFSPVVTVSMSNVVVVASGYSHSLALDRNGTVWAWGANTVGQLGDGTVSNRIFRVAVVTLTNILAIAGGADHSLAIAADNTVWAWGGNNAGQLGDGTTNNSVVPVQVAGLANITAIAGGGEHSLALAGDNTVWAWGWNAAGQLGDGTTNDSWVPVQVLNLTNVIAIAAGYAHSLALTADNTLWAWGDNAYGQLGNGTSNNISPAPGLVSGFSPTVATPIITPAGGTFTNSVLVGLSCLTPGATLTFTTDGLVPTTNSPVYGAAFSLTNSAVVKAIGFAFGYNPSAIATANFTVVTVLADLGVSKTGPANVNATNLFNYTITVTNAGPSTATSLVVTDSLPVGLTFINATAGGATNASLTNVFWSIPSLVSAAATNLGVTVKAPATGVITNLVAVGSPTPDPNPVDNTSFWITTVNELADLMVIKNGPVSVNATNLFAYTILITNAGPSSAISVVVTDSLPANLTFISATGGGATNASLTNVFWSVPALNSGAVTNFGLTVKAPATGVISNFVVVGDFIVDPVPGNNATNWITSVIDQADLVATATGPGAATNGVAFIYTLAVTNTGPSAATGITFSDTLPAGVTLNLASGGGTNANGQVGWPPFNLANSSVSNFTVSVTATNLGILTNRVQVASGVNDSNLANNTNQVFTIASDIADVVAAKSGPVTVNATNVFSYTITVSNAGPSAVASLVVTDALPVNLTFISATGGGATNASLTNVCWSIPSLASGISTNLGLTVQAPATGVISNSLVAGSPALDPVPANNITNWITSVIDQADLAAVKSGPVTIAATNQFTYTITVTNRGPSKAISLVVTDGLPANLTFINTTGGGTTNASLTNVCWAIPNLASGTATNLGLTVQAPATGVISNSLVVGSATADPVPVNNTTNWITTVTDYADLRAIETGPVTITVSTPFLYSLTITNGGPSAATSLVVTDTLPANLVFLSATGGGATNGSVTNVVWSIPILASGAATSLQLTVTAPVTGLVSNRVVASSAAIDLNLGDNTTNWITAVVLPPQLLINPGSINFGTVTVGQTNNQLYSIINNGGLALTGTATAASPFTVAGSPYTVAPGQTSTVTVAFSPLAVAAFTNNVIFASNGGNSTNQVTGIGASAGLITVGPSSLDFSTLATGSSSQLVFIVSNSGGTVVTNGTATVGGGPYSVVGGATFTVPAGGSTNVTVQFAPVSAGAFATNVVFTTANGGVATNTVTGTGAVVPVVNFSADVTNGVAPLVVTFTDTSTGTISNRNWSFGDGAVTNIVTAGITHTYLAGTNTVRLIVTGPVGVASNTINNLIIVETPPQLVVNPGNLDFGTVTVGQTNSQLFSVINTGGLTLTGTATVALPFSITGSPYVLVPGQTGAVTVAFSPLGAGAITNFVIFATTGGNSTNLVSGSGVLPPVATPVLTPAGGTYTNSVLVGLSSTTPGATLTYTTDGTGPTTNSPIYGGAFVLTNSATVRAIGFAAGYNPSTIATGGFTVVTLPSIVTSSLLPTGTVGAVYSLSMTVTAGVPPYVWSVVAGSLPSGMSLSSGGALTGIPAASSGLYNFTVQVADSNNLATTLAMNLALNSPTLFFFPPCMSELQVNLNGGVSPSTSGGSATNLVWDWGDGQSLAGWFPQTHAYALASNYTIQVTAYYDDGTTDLITQPVTVGPGVLTGCNPWTIIAGAGGSVAYQTSVATGTVSASGSITLQQAYAVGGFLTANPDSGNSFSNWLASSGISGIPNGTPVDTNSAVISVIINSNSQIQANFTIPVVPVVYRWSTIAGQVGSFGSVDSSGSSARFRAPYGVAVVSPTLAYVTDQLNYTLRRVALIDGWDVTTVAGSVGDYGSADGSGSAAQFTDPSGLARDGAGNLYVADAANFTIRQLTWDGYNWSASTIAGMAGRSGSADGAGSTAQFGYPTGVAVDGTGDVFVADYGNGTIRQLTPTGSNWVVTTIAGLAENYGSADGSNSSARFETPIGLTVDTNGNVFVVDQDNATIRKLAFDGTNWVVTTIAGLAGVAGSADGTNSAAQFNLPLGIAADGAGNLYVVDQGNETIRKLVPAGPDWIVTTIGGLVGNKGSNDGVNSDAQFYYPAGIAVDPNGDLFVTDLGNGTVRLGTPVTANPVATPAVTPAGGTFTNQVAVSLSCATVGAAIFYTTDGTDPLASGSANLYYTPFQIISSATVQVVGRLDFYPPSSVATANFTVVNTPAAIPIISPLGGTVSNIVNVALSCTTPGSWIRYTTDGTDPRTNGLASYYYSAFPLTNSTTVTAAGFANGYVPSLLATANFTVVTSPAATPSISPFGGAFTNPVSVTLSCPTPSSWIRYTTDGTDPITSGTASDYVGVLWLNQSATLRVVGFAYGYLPSAVTATVFSVVNTPTAVPTITTVPTGTAFTNSVWVYLNCSTPNAWMTYTTDGSVPTSNSTSYYTGFELTNTTTVKAIGFAPGYTTSPVAVTNLSVLSVATAASPVIAPAGGFFLDLVPVTLASTTVGATLTYTTDGTVPTTNSPVYTGVFVLTNSATVRTVTFASGDLASAESVAAFDVSPFVFGQIYQWKTIAGLAGSDGFADGTNQMARFAYPSGTVVDSFGSIFIADRYNSTIRKLTPIGTNWVVTTIAGSAWVTGSTDGTNSNALFDSPTGIAADSVGNVYVADYGTSTIRKLTPVGPDWVVTTIAGLAYADGAADGANSDARFGNPAGIAVVSSNQVVVADFGNSTIRQLTLLGTNWVVTTIAGLATSAGSTDGIDGEAQFQNPSGIAVGPSGNLFVVDEYSSTVRQLAPVGTNWMVTTIAGQAYNYGSADGTNSAARFSYASGVAVDTNGNVFVTDYYNATIRKLTPAGTNWIVTTIGGLAGFTGSADGTNTSAMFSGPNFVAVDSGGNLFVSDANNYTIRQGSPLASHTAILSVLANPANGGLVTGGGTYGVGTNVFLIATPNSHWLFTGWSDGNTNALRVVTVPPTNITYTASFIQQQVATPVLAPIGGTFTNSVLVSLSCATPGATVTYTTDGSAPTTNSAVYASAFPLSNSATVKAAGFAVGYAPSGIATGSFTVINNPAHLVVNPPTLDYGIVTVGQTHNQLYSILNSGGLVLTGTATVAGPYAIAGGSPFSVLPGQTGTVTVAFSPVAAGAFTNPVTFASNGGAMTNQVIGVGVTLGQITVNPSTLDFGTVATGSTSQKVFVVANSGGTAVTNGTVTVSGGPYSILAGATFTVPAGGATNVTVQFAPVAVGDFTNTVIFTTANGGAATNNVIGAGAVVPVAIFGANPTNGVVPLVVTFADTSTGTISNRNWSFGDGTVTNVLTAGITHTYTAGTNTVQLIVTGPLGVSTNTQANLIVVVIPPQLVVDPGALDFGSVTVGQTNNQRYSLINTGGLVLTGTATVAGPYAIAGSSAFTVQPGQTGTVTVAFSPVADGAFTNAVLFASNGGNSTNPVTGHGVAAGQITVNPSTLDFGPLAMGSTSQKVFVVANSGGTAVTNGIATVNGGPYSILAGATFTVPAGGATNVTVQFAPVIAGDFTNTVSFSTANGGAATNNVIGTGAVVPVAIFSANPTSGVAPLVVTFADTSSGTINNRNWSFGDGAVTNIPTAGITHTYAAGTNTVRLIVTGPRGVSTNTHDNLIIVVNPPQLVVNPGSLNFGTVTVGQTNNQFYSIINSGGLVLTGTAAVAGPYFIAGGNPFAVLPGQTGTVIVAFRPVAAGVFTNAAVFASNGGNSLHQVTGSGVLLPVATPVIAPAGGIFTNSVLVTLSCATPGVSLTYTTDGSTPTTNSPSYGGAFTLTNSAAVKVLGVAAGFNPSAVAVGSFTVVSVPTVATPVIAPAGGIFTNSVLVTLSCATPGVSLTYTTDGSTPTTNSSSYGGAFTLTNSAAVKVLGVVAGFNPSAVAIGSFTVVSVPTVATPVIAPVGGIFTNSVLVTLSCATPGVSMTYTTNGSTPTTNSLVYGGAFALTNSATVQAAGFVAGDNPSAIASADFTVVQVAGPDLTGAQLPAPGTNGWEAAISGTFTNPVTLNPVNLILGAFDVQNSGGTTAAASVVRFYLSPTPIFDLETAIVLTKATHSVPVLSPGEIHLALFGVITPDGVTPGGMYLVAVVDATHVIAETNEANNIMVFGPLEDLSTRLALRQYNRRRQLLRTTQRKLKAAELKAAKAKGKQ